jgi:hypothetical protein
MSEAADDTIEPADPADPAEPVGPTGGTVAQDRARDGLDHLQNAARELIAAARAALDVAEDVIDDPDTIASVVGAAGQFGGLGDLVRNLLPTHRLHRDAGGDGDGDGDGERFDRTGGGRRADGPEPGIQRIEVV